MIRSYCAYRTSPEGYKSQTGKDPVRGWLKDLPLQDKKAIGEDIKTVQFGWPLGMPLIKKLEPDLWEVRSNISTGIARKKLYFTNDRANRRPSGRKLSLRKQEKDRNSSGLL